MQPRRDVKFSTGINYFAFKFWMHVFLFSLFLFFLFFFFFFFPSFLQRCFLLRTLLVKVFSRYVYLPSTLLRHKFNDRSFLTCLCRIFLCRNLGAWQALQVWDEKNYKAISHNWINVDIPNYVNNNFWSNQNSELTDRQSGDLKNNRNYLLHLTWYTAVLFLVNQVLKIW